MTDQNRGFFVAEAVSDVDVSEFGPAPLPRKASAPRRYPYVSRLFYERPWALHLDVLEEMDRILQGRLDGIRLSASEIAERIAEGRDGQGDRFIDAGGVIVGNVAVIPMYGLLSQRASLLANTSTQGTGLDELRGALATALANPDVKAVVFDIDSPGGSVDGLPEFAQELRKARAGSKPVVAQINTLAASAAYWLAANMGEVVITPSGEAGSIGVYSKHVDYSKAEELEGVKTTLISAGPYKVEGNPYEPLGDEARTAIQEHVDTFYSQFLSEVAKGRGVTVQSVADDFGGGRTFLADKALASGMVDRIATLDETVQALQKRKAVAAPTSLRRAEDLGSGLPIAATSVARSDPGFNQRMNTALKPRKRKGALK